MVSNPFMQSLPSADSGIVNLKMDHSLGSSLEEKYCCPEGLNNFFIICTSDFTTVSKEVHIRTRRVRLLGLEVMII